MSYKNYKCYRQSLITPIAPIKLITKKAARFGATLFLENKTPNNLNNRRESHAGTIR